MRGAENSSPIVAVVTDFGLQDSYIAELYAALLKFCSNARIVTISHLVPPGDILRGAYLIGRVVHSFPAGTIFLGVVDPTVGTGRQAVIVRNGGYIYAAPDNGLLSRAVDFGTRVEVRTISPSDSHCETVSGTFHGRDIFAPVAGRLASGCSFEDIGVQGGLKETFSPSQPCKTEDGWVGEVVYTDRFGNIATNLPNSLSGNIALNGHLLNLTVGTYAEIPTGEIALLKGSDGCLEIAGNRISAERMLNVRIGDGVLLV